MDLLTRKESVKRRFMADKKFHPLIDHRKYPETEMKHRAHNFYAKMRRRRTVRDFSDEPVDRDIIESCLRAASTAPSGANQQPWQFVVVSDPAVKKTDPRRR
jgi:iodotyrosine deiodinase